MGDSKSWAYDHLDETKVCVHGVTSKYFDDCECAGCVSDRRRHSEKVCLSKEMETVYYSLLSKMGHGEMREFHSKCMEWVHQETQRRLP